MREEGRGAAHKALSAAPAAQLPRGQGSPRQADGLAIPPGVLWGWDVFPVS